MQVEINGIAAHIYDQAGVRLTRGIVLHSGETYTTFVSLEIETIGVTVLYRNPGVYTNPNAKGSFTVYQVASHSSSSTNGTCGKAYNLVVDFDKTRIKIFRNF